MITEYKCGKGNVVINLTNMKTKVKVKLKNNKPTVKLKINSKGAIQEINCNKNLEKNTTIKEIEKSAEKSLKKQIEKGIKLAQKKYKTDIFGFGNLFYKKYPQYYKKVNENWNEKTFPEIDIKIDTNINLMTKGSIEKSLLGGIHE